MSHPFQTHQRQVHLDFHTSPFIPDVASKFDAVEFARTLRDAHVNSVTIFAKCHHGMCYYPTKSGTVHPSLGARDLLGEMIEALHRNDIRAPIYTTVVWEEDVAQKHPEWRQLRRDGSFARWEQPDATKPPLLGGWRFNNYLHPDYQDYMEEHVRELLQNYDVDGIFFDILWFEPHSCWSPATIKFREKHGVMGTDKATHDRFETLAQGEFAQRFTRLIHGSKKDATVHYNSGNPLYTDSKLGIRSRHEFQTHWELESLPSGLWGYFHFPRLARSIGHWGKPWLGMTGRFQQAWGDFGGLKPAPALEYECFRTQALGGANSVGDQLPPRGELDAGAYDLIGSVYAQCAKAEPFYAGSRSLPQIGIIATGSAGDDSLATDKSLEGAVLMCDEAHYDTIVLDDAMEMDGLDLIILPDCIVLTEELRQSLAIFMQKGGKILFSNRSAFDAKGKCELDGISLQIAGEIDKYPTYCRTKKAFSPELSRSDRVLYYPGVNVKAGPDIEVLAERVLPYFMRNELTFSSHLQTPPIDEADSFPAVVAGRNFGYFADPIFREYRHYGNIVARDLWKLMVQRLIGPAPFGDGLPLTISLTPRQRGNDLILTLLHYISTRKSITADMIEERSSFAGENLRLPEKADHVIDFETKEPLMRNPDGTFALPARKGRLLLEVPGYFY